MKKSNRGPARRRGCSRREFLKAASLTVGAAALGAALPRAARLARAGEAAAASILVRGECPGAAGLDRAELERQLTGLVDAGVQALAGQQSPAAAWSSLAGPADRVAILVNGCHNSAEGPTRLELINHVIRRLIEAGVPANAIAVCERDRQQLAYGSFDRQHIQPAEVRLFSHDFEEANFGPPVQVGSVATRITTPVNEATLIVRLPLLRTHMVFGFTGALKLLMGSHQKPTALHARQELLTELNKLPAFFGKKSLIILDGVESPGYPRFGCSELLISRDPATMDYQVYQWLRAHNVPWGEIKRRKGRPSEPLGLWLQRALDDGALGSASPQVITVQPPAAAAATP